MKHNMSPCPIILAGVLPSTQNGPFPMLLPVRDIAGMIPPKEVPTWVNGGQAIIYQRVVLSTLVAYDAGKSYTIELSL